MIGSSPNPASPAEIPSGVLPTGRLLAMAVAGSAVAGLAWSAGARLLGGEGEWVMAGLPAAAVVAISAVIALVVIRPWKRRSLLTWPFLWLGGSAIRIVAVLILLTLLYFALSLETPALAVAVLVAYLLTLLGETWMYVRGMKILPPLDRQAGDPSGVLHE